MLVFRDKATWPDQAGGSSSEGSGGLFRREGEANADSSHYWGPMGR